MTPEQAAAQAQAILQIQSSYAHASELIALFIGLANLGLSIAIENSGYLKKYSGLFTVLTGFILSFIAMYAITGKAFNAQAWLVGIMATFVPIAIKYVISKFKNN